MKTETTAINIDRGKGDFFYPEAHVRDAGVGLSDLTIHYIADVKEDPDWVRDFRLRALKTFLEKPLPTHWASKELEAIDFDKIRYYLAPGTEPKRSWEEVPEDLAPLDRRAGGMNLYQLAGHAARLPPEQVRELRERARLMPQEERPQLPPPTRRQPGSTCKA